MSASLQLGGANQNDEIIRRVAAADFEKAIASIRNRWLPFDLSPREPPLAIRLREGGLLAELPGSSAGDILPRLDIDERVVHSTKDVVSIAMPLALPRRGGRRLIVAGNAPRARPDPVLIAALRTAHSMVTSRRELPIVEIASVSPCQVNLLRLAFLAPDLQRDTLGWPGQGYHPLAQPNSLHSLQCGDNSLLRRAGNSRPLGLTERCDSAGFGPDDQASRKFELAASIA